MFGHKVAIGEPLVEPDGTELKVTFERATEECLNLNPFYERSIVEAAFIDREKALDQARKNPASDQVRQGKRLFEIHTQMPIPGCYLMSVEEWNILGADFGYPNQYTPQILPKLDERWFWSSSGMPNGIHDAYYFNWIS